MTVTLYKIKVNILALLSKKFELKHKIYKELKRKLILFYFFTKDGVFV
ncbi:hypothetical protein KSS87_001637 [Heliosperma pusillum]|nr:hypothetical protein KSS87_001637 [Heliosperma pusillum]